MQATLSDRMGTRPRAAQGDDMIYAQISSGQRLHLAYEPGEGKDDANIIRAGFLSAPLCGRRLNGRGYRMTCNMPLGRACRSCNRVLNARYKGTT